MSSPEQQVETKKSRRNFLLVCAAFLVPIVIAKVALEQQWFNYGVTNQGQLLDNPVSLTDLSLTEIQPEKQWLMVFNSPDKCGLSCQKSVNALANTYVALGKEMPRVQSVLLNNGIDNEQFNLSKWKQYQVPALSHPQLVPGTMFVVDPLGNIVLTHQPPKDAEQLAVFGKAVLADMKKLLKYSRVG
ncbi:hypothetical protein HII17_15855 [Thalassotalea sp. M1531]|uniref:Thioredoxin domain-containing protein n=1 Tax=Thalassotalea algicola TaxID=2716224 RepID=A0A7Y0Q8L6_9GAMM|nr:hypothetical protein [Thalassotalea algicola]NMP33032.1 hypothetical protein [Thalassotalea algicola]